MWQSSPDAWSLTVVVKATFTIVDKGEATLAPVQSPVAAFAGDTDTAIEDLSPLKPKVDVLVLRGSNEDSATVEVSSIVVPACGPIPPFAPARRLLLQERGLEWAAAVLRGEAAGAGPVPAGFDFGFFHVASSEQRIDLLRTGTPLVLTNVLPNKARVETLLPQRKPQAFRVHPQTGKATEIILRCDTLCIDAARGLVVLTFRGIADVDAGGLGNTGTIVVAAHSAGKKIRPDRIERFLKNGDPIEGEANDGRHPLEKRYDTVLAAPKGGDTVALPDMEGSGSGAWPVVDPNQHDSGLMRPSGGLPFQAAPSDAPPPLIQPAPLHVPGGGRRHATWSGSNEPKRGPDMPFQGALPPPVAEAYMPPPPPEGVFPEPPAMLPVITPQAPPLIKPPPMLGAGFAQDEKTADLPPGHENADEATVDLAPATAAIMRSETSQPAPGLAGKPIAAPAKAPVAAPAAPKPAAAAPKAPAAPKPAISSPAAPKLPGSPAVAKPAVAAAPKPVAAGAVASKPALPTGPLKVPAPLGPKLKTDGPAKPVAPAPAPAAVKKPDAAPAAKAPAAPDKPVEQAKPVLRPSVATVPFPSMIKPGTVPAVAALAAEAKAFAADEPFDPARSLKLEECAALDAELRHRPGTRKTLLEKNKLTEEQWSAVHKHWAEAIARQTEVGERKLLLAYDAAYVGAQERLGIRVGIDTHAQLQVAVERGTTSAVLRECGLEPADQMRLGRVWTQRLADDPAKMKELAAAIEKARSS